MNTTRTILPAAYEPDDAQRVWLLVLPEEWAGPWTGMVKALFMERKDGMVWCATPHVTLAIPQTAEAAIRARGAVIVGAAQQPRIGPTLAVAWHDEARA